ncbi:MAG: 2-amino-4-hydroxy-6-hydroxymethyldihydropteridine diphosphokinase [Polyangiales bacterium]
MNAVVVGVGSNLGAREACIHCARVLLDARDGIEVVGVSDIYETEPLGPPQPHYLNAAFRLETMLSPTDILKDLLRTERRLGRLRDVRKRWGPRSIDLDLLWDRRGAHESAGLSVPHRELENRVFALAPLLDVAPELTESFGPSLRRLGGRPRAWSGEASIHVDSRGGRFTIDVEADSLLDACALCVGLPTPAGRPSATRHFRIGPSPEAFEGLLRGCLRTGFSTHRATVSDASKTHWEVQLHGVNMGLPLEADVRLWTTSGGTGRFHAQLTVG